MGHLRRRQQIHFFDTDDQHILVTVGFDGIDRVVKRDRRRGTGALAASHRLEAQIGMNLGGQRSNVLLVDKRAGRTRTDVNGVDVPGFESGVGGSCYVIHTGAANECACAADGSAVCHGSAQAERSVHFPAGGPVSLKSNSRSVQFDPAKGTSTPTATVQLQARSGAALHQVMNIMGRVRSCVPASAPALSGYRRC